MVVTGRTSPPPSPRPPWPPLCRLRACVYLCFCPWETVSSLGRALSRHLHGHLCPLLGSGLQFFKSVNSFLIRCWRLRRVPNPVTGEGLRSFKPSPGLVACAAVVLCRASPAPASSRCLCTRGGRTRQSGKMCPGAICLQPWDQMVCKDSWGAAWGGNIFTKHPASPGASYSPTSWTLLS